MDYEEFAHWIAKQIFGGEVEDSPECFCELACRKLAKLGIVNETNGNYELAKCHCEIKKSQGNIRLIDATALRNEIVKRANCENCKDIANTYCATICEVHKILRLIDNSPTIE